MNELQQQAEMKRLHAFVIKHGKAKFGRFSDGDDAEVGPREPDYLGHRLGQVWAWVDDPTFAVDRLRHSFPTYEELSQAPF